MPSNMGWDAYALKHRAPEAAGNPKWLQPYRPKATEMLFDLVADPFELNNLADDPAHGQMLKKFRAAVSKHIRETGDLGFFTPTAKAARDGALYDWVRNNRCDLAALHKIAERASMPSCKDEEYFIRRLQSPHSEIRFWAVRGLGMLGTCPDALKRAVDDPDPAVAASAAEACVYGGSPDIGMPAIIKGLKTNTGEQKDPFYSALETLSWQPAQAGVLEQYRNVIESVGGFPAKSLAVNMGRKPVDSLFGNQARKKGIKINTNRRPLEPNP